MKSWKELNKLSTQFLEKLKKLFELGDQKWSGDGPLKKNLNIFGNLLSGSWHFLRLSSKTKNKFRFLEEFLHSSCTISHFKRGFLNALAIFLTIYQSQSKHSRLVLQKNFFKKIFMALLMDGVQLSQGSRVTLRRQFTFNQ